MLPTSQFETLPAVAPSEWTLALSAAGLSHNPAVTPSSVTLGTGAAEVAAPWPPTTAWPVAGWIPEAPFLAADYALSAVWRAPAPEHAMPPGAVRLPPAGASLLLTISPSAPGVAPPWENFDFGWAASRALGAVAGGGQSGIPPTAVRAMIPATPTQHPAQSPQATPAHRRRRPELSGCPLPLPPPRMRPALWVVAA